MPEKIKRDKKGPNKRKFDATNKNQTKKKNLAKKGKIIKEHVSTFIKNKLPFQDMDVETKVEMDNTLEANMELDSITEYYEPKDKLWTDPDSDEDFDMIGDFNWDKAWQKLLNLPNSMKVPLSLEAQKYLELEVGKNVSQEHPWKQIRLKKLLDLFDDDSEIEYLKHNFNVENLGELQYKFPNYTPEDLVLVGFIPMQEEKECYYIFYGSHESAKIAGSIIKNIELYEHWLLSKKIFKRPTVFSDQEFGEDFLVTTEEEGIRNDDVEFQSVYPIQKSEIKLVQRFADNVRDGYVELVPTNKKFENIIRRRVDVAIQACRKKLTIEQQTDPTFPTNKWSEYFYEIKMDENQGLDKSDEEDNIVDGTNQYADLPESELQVSSNGLPQMSENFNYLMETISFNQIDMYRNDYQFISSLRMPKYKVSHLKEISSFIDLSLTSHRKISALDWYPTISGILAVSYTFTNLMTSINVNEELDSIKRTVLEPNPVLIWSFSDSLQYKLKLYASHEITSLSFCPFDDKLLVGGAANGSIIIWNLNNRIHNLNDENIFTEKQLKCKTIVGNYLLWMKEYDEETNIRPIYINSLKDSQKGPITAIHWLDRTCTISMAGHLRKEEPGNNKYIMTISLDGTMAFWHILSTITSNDQNISINKSYNCTIKLVFLIKLPEPCTSAVMRSNTKFIYELQKSVKFTDENSWINMPVKVTTISDEKEIMQKFITTSLYGRVIDASWEGLNQSMPEEPVEEIVTMFEFSKIHDGTLFYIEKNPFFDEIFVTIGGTIFAIWHENYKDQPFFWRQTSSKITQIHWSYNHPGVLFLTKVDGTFEIWNILLRSEVPSLSALLSDGIITSLSEQRLAISRKLLTFGDCNSNLRVFLLPSDFNVQMNNEVQLVQNYFEHIKHRHQNKTSWKSSWIEKNSDIIDLKKSDVKEKQKELNVFQKETESIFPVNINQENESIKKIPEKTSKKKHYDLPQILEKRWDEFNLKRIMDVLLAKRHIDPKKLEEETILEKERLNYIKEKKKALKKSFSTISNDFAEIRSKILPVQKTDFRRSEIIYESAINLIDNAKPYTEFVDNAQTFVNLHSSTMIGVNFYDFFSNGRERREILNKLMDNNGSNRRREYYEELKSNNELQICNFDEYQILTAPDIVTTTVDTVKDANKLQNATK